MDALVGDPVDVASISILVCRARHHVPPQGRHQRSVGREYETSFKSFVSDVVVGRLVPVLAAFCVLKAALDAAEGHSPLGSVIAAIFLLSIRAESAMQGWNSGTKFATTDMLASLGTTWLERFSRRRRVWPWWVRSLTSAPPTIHATGWLGLAFLSVSAIWKLVLAMVG